MRILVVEDEREIGNFLKSGLEAENFAVDVADCGEKGLSFALVNEYDLFILDINLPGIDGVEVCRRLRAEKKTAPVLMLTVRSEIEHKLRAFNTGADDYLGKPFSFEELVARVRALLRREKTIVDELFQIDDLVLDTGKHTVERAGNAIKLSRKEFVLLSYMMRNHKKVLSRNILLEHVWDMNADPFTNTVDVHMRFLRKKIDEKHKRKLIQTVHGYGYKIE